MSLEILAKYTENFHGRSEIFSWLSKHVSVNGHPDSTPSWACRSTNCTITLVCVNCGDRLTVALTSLGATIETLDEISKWRKGSLELRYVMDGVVIGSVKPSEL